MRPRGRRSSVSPGIVLGGLRRRPDADARTRLSDRAADLRLGAGYARRAPTLATVRIGGAVEGEFAFELYGEQAPIATANFVALARCGFYDGIKFHRVLAGFVIQAGDPADGEQRRRLRRDRHRRSRLRVRDRAAAPTGSTTTRTRSSMANDTRDERQPVLHRAGRSRRGALPAPVHDLRAGRIGARTWSTPSPRSPSTTRASASPRRRSSSSRSRSRPRRNPRHHPANRRVANRFAL